MIAMKNTPVTLAHLRLANQLVSSPPSPLVLATLIAESEAKSCGELSCDECNARTAALTAERDQLRAELALLREWQREVIQNANAHHAEREDAIARAELAEASLHALRLVCGTTDADKFSTWVDRANARAERAEAEVKKLTGFYNEIVVECGHDRIVREYRQRGELLRDEANRRKEAEAELAAERARLDWLEDHGWITGEPCDRAAIDAAMKEEAK